MRPTAAHSSVEFPDGAAGTADAGRVGVAPGGPGISAGGEDIHDATVTELKRMLTAYLWLAEKEAQSESLAE